MIDLEELDHHGDLICDDEQVEFFLIGLVTEDAGESDEFESCE